MAEVTCARCGETREGLPREPLPGADGRAILASTCAPCWKLWLGEQVKLINETRISPADPDGFAFLLTRMRAFLALPGGSEP
jgi:Fe-S cluster biosynthesis and repair protein YggX